MKKIKIFMKKSSKFWRIFRGPGGLGTPGIRGVPGGSKFPEIFPRRPKNGQKMAIFGLRSGLNIFYVRWGAKLADKGNQLAPGGSGKFDALKGCRRTSCQVGFLWLDGHMENGHFYSNTLINLTFWGIFGAGRVIFVPEGSKIQSWSANFIKKSGNLS